MTGERQSFFNLRFIRRSKFIKTIAEILILHVKIKGKAFEYIIQKLSEDNSIKSPEITKFFK